MGGGLVGGWQRRRRRRRRRLREDGSDRVVSCEKERRKRSEKSSERCPSSIFATCGHNEWPDFFFRGRYSPSHRGIVFLSKPELQISDTEPLCRTGFWLRVIFSSKVALLRALFFYNYPIYPLYPFPILFTLFSLFSSPFLSAFLPFRSSFIFWRSDRKRTKYVCIVDYSHWDERGRADSAAKEPSMVGTVPFPTNRYRTDSHRCVPARETYD